MDMAGIPTVTRHTMTAVAMWSGVGFGPRTAGVTNLFRSAATDVGGSEPCGPDYRGRGAAQG
jgi:hypothetical protein